MEVKSEKSSVVSSTPDPCDDTAFVAFSVLVSEACDVEDSATLKFSSSSKAVVVLCEDTTCGCRVGGAQLKSVTNGLNVKPPMVDCLLSVVTTVDTSVGWSVVSPIVKVWLLSVIVFATAAVPVDCVFVVGGNVVVVDSFVVEGCVVVVMSFVVIAGCTVVVVSFVVVIGSVIVLVDCVVVEVGRMVVAVDLVVIGNAVCDSRRRIVLNN